MKEGDAEDWKKWKALIRYADHYWEQPKEEEGDLSADAVMQNN